MACLSKSFLVSSPRMILQDPTFQKTGPRDLQIPWTDCSDLHETIISRMQTRPSTVGLMSSVGVMSRPAGVAGLMGCEVSISDALRSLSTTKGSFGSEHALRRHSPYAEIATPSWAPREPAVKPSQGITAAGTFSTGCIDNTYMPAPLSNGWGKNREISKRELPKRPKPQATDLLAVTKGGITPPPLKRLSELNAVSVLASRSCVLRCRAVHWMTSPLQCQACCKCHHHSSTLHHNVRPP